MHIVYSVFNKTANENQTNNRADQQQTEVDLALRLAAYKQVCNKYHDEIMAIRKYMPQWQPKFSCEL